MGSDRGKSRIRANKSTPAPAISGGGIKDRRLVDAKIVKGKPVADRDYVKRPDNMLAKRMNSNGATDVEIADALGVHVKTVAHWRAMHPGFAESCTEITAMHEARVKRALVQRAIGYEYDIVKIYKTRLGHHKVIERIKVLPDINAAAIYLEATDPAFARNRVGTKAHAEVQCSLEDVIKAAQKLSAKPGDDAKPSQIIDEKAITKK